MADANTPYPLPAFHYQVTIEGTEMHFSEVSGLATGNDPITYKHGMSMKTGDIVIPGLPTRNNVTLKKGLFPSGTELFDWVKSTEPGRPTEKKDVLVSLIGDTGEPVLTWKILQAFPVKWEGPGFNATSNEVAIETLELIGQDLQLVKQ